jgi:hypothetical protein
MPDRTRARLSCHDFREWIRTALHDLFPEPSGVRLMPDLAATTRERKRGMWAVASAVVVTAAVATIVALDRPSQHHATTPPAALPSTPPVASLTPSVSAPANVVEPVCVRKCIRPSDAVAADYIGLTLSSARHLADRRGDSLIGYGAAGSCIGRLGKVVTNPIAIAVDQGPGTDGAYPGSAKIVYAAHVDPYSGE